MKSIPLILASWALLSAGCATVAPTQSARVEYRTQNPERTQIWFFVETGSLEQPAVTLGDNAEFPSVLEIYARPQRYDGMNGVRVNLRFAGPASGKGIAVNILQPGLRRPVRLFPLPTDVAPE